MPDELPKPRRISIGEAIERGLLDVLIVGSHPTSSPPLLRIIAGAAGSTDSSTP